MKTLIPNSALRIPHSACAGRRRAARGLVADRPLTLAALTVLLLVSMAARSIAQSAAEPSDDKPTRPDGLSVSEQGAVELHVADQPLADVLQLLSLEGRRNIVASPKVTGTVTANLYGVTFEQALEAILTPNNAGFRTVGSFVYVFTREELAEQEASGQRMLATRVFHLNHVNAKDARAYIEPLLDEKESISASPLPEKGIASSADEAGGDNHAMQDFIIVTAHPAKLANIEGILRQIDIRPQQVLIEATILRAELADQNSLGIDFTIVGGVDLELLGGVSTGIQDLTLGELPTERFERFNSLVATAFAESVPDGGLTLGIIKDHVAVFLRALEQITDTTVLANPKVLALNKQKGQVIVGRRDGYLTTTVTETQTVQTVEFLETGTQLLFRPFIGTDGWIRMELHPEDSVGFVSAQGLPSKQTTEVTTNVMIRDGQTILIGGLFREVTSTAKGQVPILGNVPVIGPLFGSQDDSTSREEVIILLTVNVVKDMDAFADQSFESYQNVERVRVGARRGLMWHGHERLAQAHYQKALHHWAAGDADRALWHVRMALYDYPRLLEAVQFKEKILQARDWEADASFTRDFLYRMVAREKGYPVPPFVRPAPANGSATGGESAGAPDAERTGSATPGESSRQNVGEAPGD